MNYYPTGHQRNERQSLAQYEGKVMEGLVKARAAIEVAKNAVREALLYSIERSDELVNCEVAHVGSAQQKVRAFLTEADRAVLLDSIMQAIDDHYFLATDLMSREAGEE